METTIIIIVIIDPLREGNNSNCLRRRDTILSQRNIFHSRAEGGRERERKP